MIIKEENFYYGEKRHTKTLEYKKGFYNLRVDGTVYYTGANMLFAIQRFNEV